MDSSTSRGPRLLAALAAVLAIAGTFVAVLPPASAADMCSADNLYVVKGRLEARRRQPLPHRPPDQRR